MQSALVMPDISVADGVESAKEAFEKWCFKNVVEIEHERQLVNEQREALEKEKEDLKWERVEFEKNRESRKKLMAAEDRVFEMKLNVLKQEYTKLAAEKQYLEKQKRAFNGGYQQSRTTGNTGANTGSTAHTRTGTAKYGTVFFGGVFDEATLKKRYKDLMKIYHPDNLSGDTGVLQEINCEYDIMKKSYCVS